MKPSVRVDADVLVFAWEGGSNALRFESIAGITRMHPTSGEIASMKLPDGQVIEFKNWAVVQLEGGAHTAVPDALAEEATKLWLEWRESQSKKLSVVDHLDYIGDVLRAVAVQYGALRDD